MPNSEKPPRFQPEPSREPIWKFNATNSEGRTANVLITQKRFISEGRFGVVYEVMARTVGSIPLPGGQRPFDTKRRAHESSAIIKVFKNPADAEHALMMHRLCSDAGLRTLPTYRVDTERAVAIMTELNSEKHVALSCNNWNLRSDEIKMQEISNWEEMLQRYFDEAIKATAHNIVLKTDVYFFRIPTDTLSPQLDFFAADYDTVEQSNSIESDKLLRINIMRLYDTAAIFLQKYIAPKQWQKHSKILKDIRKVRLATKI